MLTRLEHHVETLWVPFVKYLNIFKQRSLEDGSGSRWRQRLIKFIKMCCFPLKIIGAESMYSDVKRRIVQLNTRKVWELSHKLNTLGSCEIVFFF
jgi:hypothetical protein